MRDIKSEEVKSNIRLVLNYSKKASELLPSDAKIKEFYNEVKDINQQILDLTAKEESKASKDKPQQDAPRPAGLKRVIIDDPEEKNQARQAQREEAKRAEP